MLTHFADAFTPASILAGLWAALQWWRSGKVQVEDPPDLDLSTLKGLADPRHKATIQKAVERTDTLNGHVAIWTAVSVAARAVVVTSTELVDCSHVHLWW